MPDAIIAASDILAIGAFMHRKGKKMGINIPENFQLSDLTIYQFKNVVANLAPYINLQKKIGEIALKS